MVQSVQWLVYGLVFPYPGAAYDPTPKCPDRLREPPTFLYRMQREVFPSVKQPEREADHSPPSNAEVKNEWSFGSLPYAFITSTGTY